ncbi:RNA polymerase sigma-70 factor [Marinilabiliaceae bacterium JC017]|nr:RNA polymerase sigma-70 factor [Marinilabiliaceae bacterium JC017]
MTVQIVFPINAHVLLFSYYFADPMKGGIPFVLMAFNRIYDMKSIPKIDLHLIQQGSHIEFARLVDLFSHDLFLFANGILHQAESAEEVVSDVFVKLWEKRATVTEVDHIKSYLYTAVRNKAISTLRGRKKDTVSLEDIQEYHFEPVAGPDDSMIDQETLDQINRAIEHLPARTKMVFSLAKIQGLKYKEIAELCDISVKTVDYHVAGAIEKICNTLGVSGKHSGDKGRKMLMLLFSF